VCDAIINVVNHNFTIRFCYRRLFLDILRKKNYDTLYQETKEHNANV